ncbi:hypothetical protein NUACC21_03260 [Scytonema sp. NUACC21]
MLGCGSCLFTLPHNGTTGQYTTPNFKIDWVKIHVNKLEKDLLKNYAHSKVRYNYSIIIFFNSN